MSLEFSPTAPKVSAENVEKKEINKIMNTELMGNLLVKSNIANRVYGKGLDVAEKIDDKEQTSIPYFENVVTAADLLTKACLRGAQIAA